VYVNNQLVIDDFSPTATPDTPISATPPIPPISGKIFLQAGVAYDVRLEAKNLGTDGFPGSAGSGLQASWALLQPPSILAGYNAVILALGTNDQFEGEGHDRSFRLPEQQDTLIQNVVRVNPRTIVVLHGGGGFDVQSWIDRVPRSGGAARSQRHARQTPEPGVHRVDRLDPRHKAAMVNRFFRSSRCRLNLVPLLAKKMMFAV